MKEKWQDIKGYEKLYQVSNTGKIKSLSRRRNNGNTSYVQKEQILKTRVRKKDGYTIVSLLNDVKKYYYVHRLVAENFICNDNNFKFINHKDENKSNNDVNNLEWCDRKYNNQYGNRGTKIAKKLNKKIVQYDKNNNFIREWDSIKEAKEALNIWNISQVCIGKRNKAGGFIWKFKA